MIRCKIDKSKDCVRVKATGELGNIVVEVLALIEEVNRGIAAKNPDAALEFRRTVIGVMLDPRSPMWKEE